jgi:arylsulfatase A-like enzyme
VIKIGSIHSSRPNILVITTDQQSAFALGCAGNPHLWTPAMDRIAGTGVRFEKAYASNPICVPSRTSYMTGTMPQENGVDYNGDRVSFDHSRFPILAGAFRDAGYDTGHFGKWHIPHDIHDVGWSGFNTREAVRNNGVDADIVRPCLDFITTERDGPFLAFASFVNPHDICEFARILTGMPDRLKNGDIPELPGNDELPPLPENWERPGDFPEVVEAHYTLDSTRGIYPSREWGGAADPRWRQYLWAYYRLVELVDRRVAELLDGLEAAGLARNTVVLFTSDHGDGMARHRWTQKTLFHDEVARVPFILSWPGSLPAGTVNSDHLLNLGTDLFPTLMEAAGLEQPARLKGLSALPAAAGRADAPRHPFIVSENNLQPKWEIRGEASGRMIRTRRFKYVCYSHGVNREQLFEMEADPLETRNLVTDPDYSGILAEHRQFARAAVAARP